MRRLPQVRPASDDAAFSLWSLSLLRDKTMDDLDRKAFGGLLRMMLILAVLTFLPAWTFRYWQGWLCLFVFFACALAITQYLMSYDPMLLKRRMSGGASAEKEKSQKIIQSLSSIAFISMFFVSALDHRFLWSVVPAYVVIAGDALIVLGFAIVFWVFKVNSFTSGIIEVAAEQTVISTGPYGLVRHPMYFGALIMLFGIPIALGSWWGLVSLVPMTLVIGWRLLDEEVFLIQNLPGYAKYRETVRYRLFPFLW
jgi:protein-S-isoprenylcysteine O-methyltransferase Ste14